MTIQSIRRLADALPEIQTIHHATQANAQSDPHIIPIQTQHLKLYQQGGCNYVTLAGLAQLMRYQPPEQELRMLRECLSNHKQSLPKDSVIKLGSGDCKQIALTLPAAIKLLSRSNATAYIKLHNTLLDVLISHLRAINANKQAQE